VLNFRDIARAMHPEQPFYGLQASGVDGVSQPHTTIDQMAEAYVTEIREFQPHGPYLLGGYSGGGIVAFEMARRLTGLGEEVGLLAFIDTFHPQMPARDITLLSRLERLHREGVGYIREALERQRRDTQVARDDRAIELHVARGESIPFNLRELYLWRNFERAQAAYRPQPWNGHATLFRAEELDYFFRGGGPTYGWDRDVLGGVDVVTIPGNHSTLLVGANAELLVHSLSAAIDRVSRSARVPLDRYAAGARA
jgi:thioesterase domain-containing protein